MDWHKRYLQQAAWTRDLRSYLFAQAGLSSARRVLEVGCGSGAVMMDIDSLTDLHGLDINRSILDEAKGHVPQAFFICGDALNLPFPRGSFDITFCHFLLIWVTDPVQALREMRRVTRPGGSILACAEPDYSARVDEPQPLAALGRLQTKALRKQGADPALGAHLADLFRRAGILTIETGVLQDDTKPGGFLSPQERDLEWQVLEADLAGSISPQELHDLKTVDDQAWEKGERRLYVPTCFAWGRA